MRITSLPEGLPVPAGYLTRTSARIIESAVQDAVDEYGAKAEATGEDEELQDLNDDERDKALRLLDDAVADAVVTVSWPAGHPLATDDQGRPVVYQLS